MFLYIADQFIVFIHAYWKPNHENEKEKKGFSFKHIYSKLLLKGTMNVVKGNK